ncbi:MAG: hypothetical protein Q9184_003489 [Pyrenodesmia sp. 2 TL-2023]
MARIIIDEDAFLRKLYDHNSFSHFPNLRPIPHNLATQNRPFHPPSPTATPLTLFSGQTNHHDTVPAWHFIRNTNAREALIFISGCCLGNGTPNPRAGYGIQWGPNTARNAMSYRLEGPGPQTSNRAELRAAIVALGGLRQWPDEGLRLDAEVEAEQVEDSKGTEVANRDLWEELIGHLEGWDRKGLLVQFWLIPKAENGKADALAKEGAEKPEEVEMLEIFQFDDSENVRGVTCHTIESLPSCSSYTLGLPIPLGFSGVEEN